MAKLSVAIKRTVFYFCCPCVIHFVNLLFKISAVEENIVSEIRLQRDTATQEARNAATPDAKKAATQDVLNMDDNSLEECLSILSVCVFQFPSIHSLCHQV